jgi:hypothetical protein
MIFYPIFVFYNVLDPDPYWHTDLGPDHDAMKRTKNYGKTYKYIRKYI